MNSKPERARHERQDWAIVLIILLLGFLCVISAGQWALRLSPSWKLDTDMGSNLDPNRDFLTNKPVDLIVPLDPDILTQPAWEGLFTPGADFVTRTPLPTRPPSTATAPVTELPTLPTLPAGTSTLLPTSTAVPTNTFVWLPLPPATATKKKPPADPPTNTPLPSIDLEITMTDSGSYVPGAAHDYTVTVRNNSAYDVTGALVNDLFGAQVTGVSWICTPSVPAAVCTNGAGNPFVDTISLPAGQFVTYTVTVSVHALARGPLGNTATVTTPAFETDPGDNMAVITTAGPAGGGGTVNIGPGDTVWESIPAGNSITMIVSPAIIGDGTGSYDFVYYERYAPPLPSDHVDLDAVQILISSDGVTWNQVFYWGGGGDDTNTNVVVPIDSCITEADNCSIFDTSLYNSTGIAIDIDNLGLSGSYPWIQIVSPDAAGGDADGWCDIDALQPYYP